jgi:DNA-binding response OmpR family regulator
MGPNQQCSGIRYADTRWRQDLSKHFQKGGTEVGSVLLFVEDNKSDVFLVREALNLHNVDVEMLVLDDGEKAVRWIENNDKSSSPTIPAAILLDLNLPRRHGAEVLEHIRSSNRLRETPVVIFSSSSSYRDRALAERHPSTNYFRKSADIDEFMGIGSLLRRVIAGNGAATKRQ